MDGVHVSSGTESGFKSYADAQANPDLHLPVLRVDLHVYAANPQERFVLINMRRMHEGDALPEGGHLESITPEGVVLSYQGTKFFLEHEEFASPACAGESLPAARYVAPFRYVR